MVMQTHSNVSHESKIRSPDRILVLEQIDGKKPLGTTGEVDTRLFKTGEEGNKLHAVMDLQTSLWSLKYEKGNIPPALQSQFTSFNILLKHVSTYFTRRNIQVKEVRD